MYSVIRLVGPRNWNARWAREKATAVETQGVVPVQVSAQVWFPRISSDDSPMICVDRPCKVCPLSSHFGIKSSARVGCAGWREESRLSRQSHGLDDVGSTDVVLSVARKGRMYQ